MVSCSERKIHLPVCNFSPIKPLQDVSLRVSIWFENSQPVLDFPPKTGSAKCENVAAVACSRGGYWHNTEDMSIKISLKCFIWKSPAGSSPLKAYDLLGLGQRVHIYRCQELGEDSLEVGKQAQHARGQKLILLGSKGPLYKSAILRDCIVQQFPYQMKK